MTECETPVVTGGFHPGAMMTSMKVRLLTESDATAWWRLRRLALETEPHSFAESVAEHDAKTLESTRSNFRSFAADNFIVGAFEQDELCGTAGFYRQKHGKFQHKGHIWGVYVRRESRRQGVARAVMQDIIRRAATASGIEQITLTVSATLEAPRRLYLSLGFRTYGVEPRSLKIGSEYVDDELMVLFLGDQNVIPGSLASDKDNS
jgi:ribosomal protein S18 acetylase RimI-like enzyme